MKYTVLIFLIISFSLSGQTKVNQEAVVTSFEVLLKKHFESYNTDNRERIMELGGGWAKSRYEPFGEYAYDIQVTSSLISPFTAYCEFKLTRYVSTFHKSKSDAEENGTYDKSNEITHKHYYSYQKGKWVVKKREHNAPLLSKWFDCDEVLVDENGVKETNINGCFEENF